MALLHCMNELKNALQIQQLTAVHLNHNIRGEEAKRDEVFVQEQCEKWNIPLMKGTLEWEESDAHPSEEQLRNRRYVFFEQCLQQDEAQWLLTAHTASDQAETMLWNAIRGTGLSGLGGIPAIRGKVIRPMLQVTRREVEAYCEQHEIAFVTDSTNQSSIYTRNRIRQEVVPVLEQLNGQALQHLTALSERAEEADDYLFSVAKDYCSNWNGVLSADTLQLKNAPGILQHYVIRALLAPFHLKMDSDVFHRCLQALNRQGRCQIQGDYYFVSTAQRCYVEGPPVLPASSIVAVRPDEPVCWANRQVTLKKQNSPFLHKDNSVSLCYSLIDYDKVTGSLYLRRRLPGDTFTSARRKCTKPVKKWLNEAGFPRSLREQLVLLCDEEGIVWLEGEGVCSRCAVNQSTCNPLFVDIQIGGKSDDER